MKKINLEPKEISDDKKINLRPRNLEKFIGQDNLKSNLKTYIESSKKRKIILIILFFMVPQDWENYVSSYHIL